MNRTFVIIFLLATVFLPSVKVSAKVITVKAKNLGFDVLTGFETPVKTDLGFLLEDTGIKKMDITAP
ncbi:MAG: hypothetical protein NT118_17205, partial [Lentisphaerae bacterium]|nr:hypothetical protein [Lentisphaerota bacterium]